MKAYLTSFWLLCFVLVLTVTGIVILEVLKDHWATIDPDAGIIDDDDFYEDIGQGWHQMDLGPFSISTPTRFLFRQLPGLDSYAGEITDGESVIFFDYGWLSASLDGRNPEVNEGARDTICGIPAYFVRPTGKGGEKAAAHFSHIDGKDELNLYADQQMNSGLFIQIMLTIRFPGCEEKVELDPDLPLFSQASVPGGKFLFQICAACHKVTGTLVGPGLGDVSVERFEEWYFGNEIPTDTTLNWQGPRIHRKLFPVSNKDREALKAYIYEPYFCY